MEKNRLPIDKLWKNTLFIVKEQVMVFLDYSEFHKSLNLVLKAVTRRICLFICGVKLKTLAVTLNTDYSGFR